MEGIRISELPEKASASVTDIVPIIDVGGSSYVTKRTTVAGLMAEAISSWWSGSSYKTKLDGVQSGATANSTDAQLRDRSTHTGSQAINTVSGLQTALDGKVSNSSVVVASGKILTTNNSIILSAVNGASVAFGVGGTVMYASSVVDGGQY